jgi:flavin-dependent thymidylate synthase
LKVNLVYYTGMGIPDPAMQGGYAARLLVYTKNTRLEQGEATRASISTYNAEELKQELHYVANTIRSSWEFIDFIFEVQGVTRAFTHQMVRTRTASYAQQAQRVVDMSGFGYEEPAAVSANANAHEAWEDAMASIRSAYQTMVANGIAAQDARGVLPTNVHTNIMVKMNLRTFADLVGKRQNLRAQGEYADVVRAMVAESLKAMPWVYPFLFPERTLTPALDKMLKTALGDRSPIDAPEVNKALKEVDALKATWG